MIKMTQPTFSALELCSRCIHTEIQGWMDERWQEIDLATKNLIVQELRTVKLKPGVCVACNNTLIADKIAERVLSILEERKISEEIVKEFKKYFLGF
ncbi:MAG: hypothetical protein NT076_05930 [Candidatus Pacearchaeota archaeon]|nr:hypothetical protein [Candidatus Pacearchaeota archaeon]